jgi:ribosomal protein L7Ae-like RNA K-turn-binding protein
VPFVDILGRAPGRGVYVSPDSELLAEALSERGLAKAFKNQAARLDEAGVARLIADTRARLEDRILELVSLARRAGKVEIGMDAVLRAAAGQPDTVVIVAAKDLSERSERSIPQAKAVIRISDKATLGVRLGRDEVGIVAIRPSVFTERVECEAERLRAVSSTSTKTVRHGRVRARQKRARDND